MFSPGSIEPDAVYHLLPIWPVRISPPRLRATLHDRGATEIEVDATAVSAPSMTLTATLPPVTTLPDHVALLLALVTGPNPVPDWALKVQSITSNGPPVANAATMLSCLVGPARVVIPALPGGEPASARRVVRPVPGPGSMMGARGRSRMGRNHLGRFPTMRADQRRRGVVVTACQRVAYGVSPGNTVEASVGLDRLAEHGIACNDKSVAPMGGRVLVGTETDEEQIAVRDALGHLLLD